MDLFFTRTSVSDENSGKLNAKKSPHLWRNFMATCLLLVAACAPSLSKAQTLTIGTGATTSSYYPIYTYYGYNYSQQTFLASEIVAAGATSGTPGYISAIYFNPASFSSDWSSYCKDWVVYLGNTSKTTFASTSDWVPLSGLTKVYDGTVLPTGTGWFKITFPTAFYWDGSSNLVVAVDENTPGYATSTIMSWYTTSRTGTRSISFYNDGTNPDPASPPTANTSYAGTPHIKLDYTPATPCTGTTVGGTTVASSTTVCPGNTVSLTTTGATVGTGITWQWESASASTGPWTTITGATSSSLVTTPAAGVTTYYRRSTTCTSTSSSAYSTTVSVSVSTASYPPYTETFEGATAGVNVPCAAGVPGFTSSTLYYGSSGDYWKILSGSYAGSGGDNHTAGGSKYLVAGYNIGTYSGGVAGYWYTPGINLASGKTYRFSYWYRVADYVASYYPSGADFGMYYNTAQSATGAVAIKPDLLGKNSNIYAQSSGDFSVGTSGVYYLAAKVQNASSYGYYGSGIIDDFNLIELPACSTATASTFGSGGKAASSPSVMCALPGTTTLSLTSTPPFSGLSFAWEVATGTATTFTAITGATTSAYAHSITAGGSYFFRCKVTCAATGLSAYSDTTKVLTTPITPPYLEDFEGVTPGVNVPCASNTYSWGDYYWWTRAGVHPYSTGIRNHTTGGNKYLHAGLYLGNVSSGGDEYWFTPGLALTAAKAYNVSFWYSNAAYSTSYSTIKTTIGIAAGLSQTKAAMTIAAGIDTGIYLNAVMTPTYNQLNRGFLAPTTGTYYVGIKVNHSGYSYYGMAIDDIGVDQLPSCSAKPSAGSAVASPNLICSTGSTTVSLSGISLASDLSFQWQDSSAAGGWNNIVGATSPSYTTATLTSGPWFYRCIVTCGAIATPNTDISASVRVSVGALDLPYVETFETGITGVNMPCAAVAGTFNSSSLLYWNLRSGDYSSSYPGIKNHTPGGSNYIYCGYYIGPYYSTGDQFFWFTPALKMTAGKAYSVGFWYNGSGYSVGYNGMKIGIYAGTTQSAAGMILRAGGLDSAVKGESSTYAQMVRSFVAPTTGNYYVGIKMYHTGYDYPGGVIDDVNVSQMADCSGKPVAGTPDGFPYILCSSGTTRLRLSGTSVASGITYQWLSSTAGPTTGFAAAVGGTGANTGSYLTGTITTTTWYKCVVSCSTSGQSDTSVAVAMNVGAITPPYTEDFERGIVGTNLPCAAVNGTWATASTYVYWTLKGSPLSSSYSTKNITPGGSQYLYGGYYAGTYYSPSTPYFWMTPAIKLTAGNTYEFSYWYLGSGYTGGSTNLGMYYGTTQTAAGMTTAIRPDLVGQNTNIAKQLIGRFVAPASANYYLGIKVNHTTYTYSGMAIDDIGLNQLPPCSGVPTVGKITPSASMLCSAGVVTLDMDLSTVTKASGLTYTWYSSTTSATAGFGTMSAALTSPTYTTPTLTGTTWFYAVVKCSLTGDSAISSVIKVDVGAIVPPYIETFETVTPGTNAPCASYTYGFGSYSYWYTYGSPLYAAGAPGMDNHTPGGSRYLSTGYYPGYYSGDFEYWFTPAIKFTGGTLYQFSFWYNRSGYAPTVDATFGAYYGTAQTKAAMTTAIAPDITGVKSTKYKQFKALFTPAASGTFYIGIKTRLYGYDYYGGSAIDDIGLQAVPPCSAPVTAGKISADPIQVCTTGGSTVLDLDGSTLATGLTYDWYAATTPAGPFVATGGTTIPYNTDPLVSTTWFKAVVKCSASGISDTTAAFKVGVGGFDLPYKEDFESTSVGGVPLCSDATLWSANYYQGWYVNGSVITGPYQNNTPGGKNYLVGGYYLGSPSSTSEDNYWFTPGLNLRTGYKYNLSFYYLPSYNVAYKAKMGVYIGKSQSAGAMTTPIVNYRVFTNTAYERMDTSLKVATSGTYYLGFRKSGSNPGSTYDYYGVAFDDINLNYAPCDGMPMGGAVSASVPAGTALCVGTSVTLTNTGSTYSLVPGIKYQWMRRSLSVPGSWSVVSGAKDTVLKADTLIGFEYKMAVVCGNTNDSAFSSIFQLPALPKHPDVVISPSTSPITYCLGDTVKFNATGFSGGNYDWMRDSVVVPGWKFSDMGATEPGVYMVKVTSPLSPCPAFSNKVTLNVNDPGYSVSLTAPTDSIICAGSAVLLSATATKTGVTYQWRKDNVSISGATGTSYLAATSGYYRVIASDGISSCAAASRNIKITVRPNPPAIISVPGGTTTACENEGVLLNANLGSYSYEWLRGGSTMAGWTDSSYLIKVSGTYTVKVRTADGCVGLSTPITVNILPSPVPVIVKTIAGTSVTLSTGTYINYQWMRNGVDIPGAVSSTLPLTLNGIYKVRVSGTNNCDGISAPIEIAEAGLSINTATLKSDQIRIYPNPTQSKVFIESPVTVKVAVKDATGKEVLRATETKEVDLSKFADGIYLFTISDAAGNELIKQQRVTKLTNK